MDCLILNSDLTPISILPLSVISWQDAMKLIYLEKLVVLEEYKDWVVHSAHDSFKVPSVCVTKEYLNYKKAIRFSRANLYLRDLYQCQFCGDTFDSADLTIDHVNPRAKGGKTVWENCVSACKPCNHKKGDKIIKPLKPPHKPDYYNLVGKWKQKPVKVRDAVWLQYLGITLFD